jgi:hypothetical protein
MLISRSLPSLERACATRLRLALKAVKCELDAASVEREFYGERRVLWMIERKAVTAPDQTLETGILDAIQQAL